MFSILGTIIVGLIVGVLARFLLPGSENLPGGAIGVLITIVVGIVGAFIGSFIGQALGFAPRDGNASYAAGWIMSIIGAVVLLLLVRLLFGRRGTTTV